MAKANNTRRCSVDGCRATKLQARGWCSMHYARWRKTGSTSRECVTCGMEIATNNGGSKYCSDSCRVCGVEGCRHLVVSGGFCEGHYRRSLQYGGPARPCRGCGASMMSLGGAQYCGDDCRPRCEIDGCEDFIEGRGLCKPHYHSLYKGRDPKTYRKPSYPPRERRFPGSAPEFYICDVCGKDFKPWGQSAKHCSKKCKALFGRYGANVPSLDFKCICCGELVKRDRFSSHGLKPNKSRCDKCSPRNGSKKMYRSFYSSPKSRVEHCALCGSKVDRTLAWPHPLSKSVDHIVPLAKGGTDDLDNLQLAHLTCNQKKQARLDRPVQMALSF